MYVSYFNQSHDLQLASEFEKSVPCDEETLIPFLSQLLMENFGATPKQNTRV